MQVTFLDKLIAIVVVVLIVGILFQVILKLPADTVNKLIDILSGLIVLFIGKKVPQNL